MIFKIEKLTKYTGFGEYFIVLLNLSPHLLLF